MYNAVGDFNLINFYATDRWYFLRRHRVYKNLRVIRGWWEQ